MNSIHMIEIRLYIWLLQATSSHVLFSDWRMQLVPIGAIRYVFTFENTDWTTIKHFHYFKFQQKIVLQMPSIYMTIPSSPNKKLSRCRTLKNKIFWIRSHKCHACYRTLKNKIFWIRSYKCHACYRTLKNNLRKLNFFVFLRWQ